MTKHNVTVEKTVQEEETVWTCDYCGLGSEAGEIIEYEPVSTDVIAPETGGDETDLSKFVGGDAIDDSIPPMHYHVSCINTVVIDDEQVAELTLSEQYKRRTGNGLVFVFPAASMLPVVLTLTFGAYWYFNTGLLATVTGVLAGIIGLLTLIGARKMAKQTIKEFTT